MTGETVPIYSDRGFKHFEPIPGDYGGSIRVYESSSAEGPHLWVNIKGCPIYAGPPVFTGPETELTVHLPLESAAKLIGQLEYLVNHHYQISDFQ